MEENQRQMTDWLLAAAGDEVLAEELKTGRCLCGVLLSDRSPGCRRHDDGKRQLSRILKAAMRSVDSSGYGPRGEDLELLGRYLPKGFLFCYEILIQRGVAVPGSMRGGRGYDETPIVGAGRPVGGLGTARSGVAEKRLAAAPARKSGGSGKAVIRDEAAVAYRASVDRRLRKLAREMTTWLEEGARGKKTFRKCTGRRCGQFAEDGWNFCPTCGSATEEYEKK